MDSAIHFHWKNLNLGRNSIKLQSIAQYSQNFIIRRSTLLGDDVIERVRRIGINMFEITIQLIEFIDLVKIIGQCKLCNLFLYVVDACKGLF